MKCWECKKPISRAIRVCYLSPEREKFRDVCIPCHRLLPFNPCHFVEVERITLRKLK